MMNKIIKILSLLLFSSMILTSCLETEETETTPECAIQTFSVGNISSAVTITDSNGNDTTITRSIAGSSIKFNIDQVNGIITTVDSVANWIDLSKVCPSFTATGTVLGKVYGDSLYYVMTSGSDSINLENPLELVVYATNGEAKKTYTVSIKKSSVDTESFNWTNHTNNFALTTEFKTITLNNTVYAFAENAEGNTLVTSASTTNNLSVWTTPAELEGVNMQYESVVVYKDNIYALGKDGYIYKAADSSNPTNWEKMGDKIFSQLLAADRYYIYAYDGNSILSTSDFTQWTECGTVDTDMIPTKCLSDYSYQSRTNANIDICMISGLTDMNSKNGVSWYKVSSEQSDVNQDWRYVSVTSDNEFGLPKFDDMSATIYNGSIYAIGIIDNSYEYLYNSQDNGITWKTDHEGDELPTGLDASNGSADIISAGGKLWIIQQGGNVWSGSRK